MSLRIHINNGIVRFRFFLCFLVGARDPAQGVALRLHVEAQSVPLGVTVEVSFSSEGSHLKRIIHRKIHSRQYRKAEFHCKYFRRLAHLIVLKFFMVCHVFSAVKRRRATTLKGSGPSIAQNTDVVDFESGMHTS